MQLRPPTLFVSVRIGEFQPGNSEAETRLARFAHTRAKVQREDRGLFYLNEGQGIGLF